MNHQEPEVLTVSNLSQQTLASKLDVPESSLDFMKDQPSIVPTANSSDELTSVSSGNEQVSDKPVRKSLSTIRPDQTGAASQTLTIQLSEVARNPGTSDLTVTSTITGSFKTAILNYQQAKDSNPTFILPEQNINGTVRFVLKNLDLSARYEYWVRVTPTQGPTIESTHKTINFGDLTPPVITSLKKAWGDTLATSNSTVSFLVEANEASYFQFCLSTSVGPCGKWYDAPAKNADKQIRILLFLKADGSDDGLRSIQVRARDIEGNQSTSQDLAWFNLDTQDPKISDFKINHGAESATTSDLSLDLTVSDLGSGVSGIRYQVDGTRENGWSVWDKAWSHQDLNLSLSAGQHTIYVEAKDLLDHISRSSDSIRLDFSAPLTPFAITSERIVANSESKSATLFLTATAPIGQVLVLTSGMILGQLKPGDAGKTTVEIPLENLKENTEYEYWLFMTTSKNDQSIRTDNAKKKFSTTQSNPQSPEVDTGAVIIQTLSNGANLSFSSPTPGVTSYQYRIWKSDMNTIVKDWTLISGSFAGVLLSAGQYIVEARAILNGLHLDPTPIKSPAFTVSDPTSPADTTAPMVNRFLITQGAQTYSQTVDLSFDVSDPSGVSQMTIWEQGYDKYTVTEPYSAAYNFKLSDTSGDKVIYAVFRDSRGNLTQNPVSARIKLLEVQTGPVTVQTTASGANITVSSPTPGVTSYLYQILKSDRTPLDTGWTPVTGTTFSVALPAGQYVVDVKAVLNGRADPSPAPSSVFSISAAVPPDPVIPSVPPFPKEVKDGNIVYAPDGSIARFQFPDGREIIYTSDGTKGIDLLTSTKTLEKRIQTPDVKALDETSATWKDLEGGIRAYYRNNQLIEMRTGIGIRITDFTFAAQNALKDAVLTYPDGLREQVGAGYLLRRISVDGTITDFLPTGQKVREISSSGIRKYSYVTDSLQQILETHIREADGKETIYAPGGLLKEVRYPDGRKLVYNSYPDSGNTRVTLDSTKSILPTNTGDSRWSQHTKDLISGYYDAKGNPLTLVLRDETSFSLTNGQISSYKDSAGAMRYFDYVMTNGIVAEIHVRWPDGTSGANSLNYFVYDNRGILRGAQTANGFVPFDAAASSTDTIFRAADGSLLELANTTIRDIILYDGTRVDKLSWNGSQLTNLNRTTVNGFETTYASGQTSQQKDASGNEVKFDPSQKPDLVVMDDGRTYRVTNKDLGNGQTERILDLQTKVFGDGSTLEFKDGETIRYVQKLKTQITATVEAPKNLPVGQVFVARLRLVSGEMRNVIIEGPGRIVSGEIVMNDGNQYFFENGKLSREVTRGGQILYFSNQTSNPSRLFEKISDPELGDADLSAYYSASTDISKYILEFKKTGGTIHKIALQDYLVQNGHDAVLTALCKGFKQDILNASNGQSRFFQDSDGNLAVTIRQDDRFGEVRQLSIDLRANFGYAGFYADFSGSGLDLAGYDFVSIPYRSTLPMPQGTKIKVEFKHGLSTFTTDTAYSEEITADWQYLQIPILKDYGPIRQITVVLIGPNGQPLKNTIEIGPLSGFQRRMASDFDWAGLLGKTSADIQTLLQAEAKKSPTGGVLVEEEVLKGFKVDSKGRVVSGALDLKDGSTQFFESGKLSKWIFKNGNAYYYSNGLAQYADLLLNGQMTRGYFYYDMAFDGTIRSFVLETQDVRREFSNTGELVKLTAKGYIVYFKSGKIDTIEVPYKGTWKNLVYAADGNVLIAEFYYLDGKILEMDLQAGVYRIKKTGGITVEYKGSFIKTISINSGTKNTKADFEYRLTSDEKLLDAVATYTDFKTNQIRTMPLAEFLDLPGCEIERNEVLTKPEVDVLTLAGVGTNGLYSIGALNYPDLQSGESNSVAHTPGQAVVATGTFKYQESSLKNSIIGMYINHKDRTWRNPFSFNTGSSSSSYNFLSITMREDPSMSWKQDYLITVKGTNFNPLYSFLIKDLEPNFHTYMYSIDDRNGQEGEVTLELVREHDGSGKSGTVYLKDMSYWSIMKVSDKFWQDQTTVTAQEMKFLKVEADQLARVNASIMNKKSVQYEPLGSMSDIPTRLIYRGPANNQLQLQSFKKVDGSEVALTSDGHVSTVTLADKTVYQYAAQGQKASGVIKAPATDGGVTGNIQYQYGNVREIFQADGTKVHFDYETDPQNGAEITVMKDEASGETRRYENGQILRVTSGSEISSRYQYRDGELTGAETVYQNRVLDSVSYEYRDDETFVTDERGTTWVYDKNGNLLRHLTRDGYLYVYSGSVQEFPTGVSTNGTNLNFNHKNVPALTDKFVLPDGDYKRAFFYGTNLQAVSLGGFETTEGAQLTFDFKKDGLGEIKLPNGDHAVNLEFGTQSEILNGQIQFRDGSILEIKNGLAVKFLNPKTGTTQSTELPDLKQFDKIQVLETSNGSFGGWKLQKGNEWYTYASDGFLSRYDNDKGETYFFTRANGGNSITQIDIRQRSTQAGAYLLKDVEFYTDSNTGIRFRDDDQNISLFQKTNNPDPGVENWSGNGFMVSVYKPEFDRWDTFNGIMYMNGDRLHLRQILDSVPDGQSVAFAIRDKDFSKAEPELLAALGRFGAAKAEGVAKSNNPAQPYYLFSRPGLKSGEAREAVGVDKFFSYDPSSQPTASSQFFKIAPYRLVNNALAFDNFNTFMRLYSPLKLRQDLEILTVYNDKDEIVFSKRADGVVAFYEHGKIRETFNAQGELVSEHHYTCPNNQCTKADDMTLVQVELIKARRDFEAETRKMHDQMEKAETNALLQLVISEEPARLNLIQTRDDIVKAYDVAISELEGYRYQQVKVCRSFTFFKSCSEVTVEAPGVKEKIDQFSSERSNIITTVQEQITNLPSVIVKEGQAIRDEVKGQKNLLQQKKEEYELDVLKREIEPVLMDFYRRLLGRDPGDDELDAWAARAKTSKKLDIAALANDLNAKTQSENRRAEITGIIDNVAAWLSSYTRGTPDQRQALLTQYHVDQDLAVQLTQTDKDRILEWLRGRDLHFGYSAFLSLQSMLASKGVFVDIKSLAQEAILIDILTGVINPFAEGELLLSVYAMTKAAEIHGNKFSGVKYTYDDLRALYKTACPAENESCGFGILRKDKVLQAGLDWNSVVTVLKTNKWAEDIKNDPTSIRLIVELESVKDVMSGAFGGNFQRIWPVLKQSQKRVIAHIGEDHFVVITNVTDTEVSYLETIRGAKGSIITIAKEQFLETWQIKGGGGYLIVNQPEVIQGKAMSRETALKVRGACWPLVLLIIFWTAVVLSIASAIVSVYSPKWGKILGYAAMVASIISIVGSIGQLAWQGLKAGLTYIGSHSLLEIVKAGISQIGKLIMLPVKFVGRFFQQGFQFLKEGFRTGLEKLSSGIMKLGSYIRSPQGALWKNPITGLTAPQFTAGQTTARFLLATGLDYSVSKGLHGMGLNASLSRLGGAFASAGMVGTGAQGSSFFKSGLEGLLLQGVNEMALHLGVPPPMTAGLSFLTQGALRSYFDPNLSLKDA
ncbi:MAG: RHS repeat protein, partial [Candidatus Omnitrophica bacterium]|nr:RHS repeat protein [Candidatus Omnitrophota bacterium]